MSLRFIVWIFPVVSMILGTGAGYAQDYPNKPIRLITVGVGGATDLTARLVAQGISGPLGQPVIVDNRATGVLAAEFVSRAAPDGYTAGQGRHPLGESTFDKSALRCGTGFLTDLADRDFA